MLPSLSGAVSVRIETRPNIAVGTVPGECPPTSSSTLTRRTRSPHSVGDGTVPLIVSVRDADRQRETRTLISEMAAPAADRSS